MKIKIKDKGRYKYYKYIIIASIALFTSIILLFLGGIFPNVWFSLLSVYFSGLAFGVLFTSILFRRDLEKYFYIIGDI